MCFANALLTFAQSQITHTVVRGESLEGIANKYNVTVESILEMNPDAKDLFFVGLKLNIPSPSEKTSVPISDNLEQPISQNTLVEQSITPISAQPTRSLVDNASVDKDPNVYNKAGHGNVTPDMNFLYITNAPKENSFSGGFSIGLGYRYYFHDNIFAEGTLGYKFATSFGSVDALGKSVRFSSDEHDITVPIHLGAYVPTSNKFGLGFIAGPRIDIPVANKSEYNHEKQNVKLPATHVSLEFGVDFMFKGIGVRVMYGVGLAEFDKSQRISIGWTTSIAD